MTIPTRALSVISLALVAEVAAEPCRGVPRREEAVLEVVAVGVDVAHLAARPQLLAVEVDPQPRVAGQRVRVAVVEAADLLRGAAEDVDHHRPRRPGRGRAE